MKRFQYRICQLQQSRVTYVNGTWKGEIAPEAGNTQAAFESCPFVWDYLQAAGEQGWELVTSAPMQAGGAVNLLYLKRSMRLLV